jgi:hypothetical protein
MEEGREAPHKQEVDGSRRPDWYWEIAIAVNAAFKGLLGSTGQSGQICARTIGLSGYIDLDSGWPEVVATIVSRLEGVARDGDVVVVAEKVVAAAQQRIGPRSVLLNPDPKTIPAFQLPELAAHYQRELGFPVRPLHLILADEYSGDRATLGVLDHNAACTELADAARRKLGLIVDVIIADTDTGLDTRQFLIGTLTIGATPIGATAGVTLYEAMRCAVAAEFVRGHDRMIPVVVCIPADRRRSRPGIGRPRAYSGALDAGKEQGLTFA